MFYEVRTPKTFKNYRFKHVHLRCMPILVFHAKKKQPKIKKLEIFKGLEYDVYSTEDNTFFSPFHVTVLTNQMVRYKEIL